MNKTIGEESGESCSMCGRANTWHPDCPICKYIIDLEMLLKKAIKILDNDYGDPWTTQQDLRKWEKEVLKKIK